MNSREQHLHSILACLADPSRFRISLLLRERAYYVSELAAAVGKSQSCTTRHLQALARVGLVRRQRQGRRVNFQIDQSADVLRLLGSPTVGAAIPEARRPAAPAAEGQAAEAAEAARSGSPVPARPARATEIEDYLL